MLQECTIAGRERHPNLVHLKTPIIIGTIPTQSVMVANALARASAVAAPLPIDQLVDLDDSTLRISAELEKARKSNAVELPTYEDLLMNNADRVQGTRTFENHSFMR